MSNKSKYKPLDRYPYMENNLKNWDNQFVTTEVYSINLELTNNSINELYDITDDLQEQIDNISLDGFVTTETFTEYTTATDRELANINIRINNITTDFVSTTTFNAYKDVVDDTLEDLQYQIDNIDLSGYVTDTELTTALADYVTNTALTTTLADYVTDTELTTTLSDYVSKTDYATDSTYGIIKTNTTLGISLNNSGNLEVTGRFGETAQGGRYLPMENTPLRVGENSILLSKFTDGYLSNYDIAIIAGISRTLKVTAEAGATEYRIANTQVNRYLVYPWSRLAVSDSSSTTKTVGITSITVGGNPLTPYHEGGTGEDDIVITVDETLNPDSTLASVYGIGKHNATYSLILGESQSTGSSTKGTLVVGRASYANSTYSALIGDRLYSTGNNGFVSGSDMYNTKNLVFLAGQGHDTSNSRHGVAAVGLYSVLTANTYFAVGDGTNSSAKSNIFEVSKSGNATKLIFKDASSQYHEISADASGNLTYDGDTLLTQSDMPIKTVIQTNNTTADTTHNGYKFVKTVTATGVTADHMPVSEVTSGTLNGEYMVETLTDTINIYFRVQPVSNAYITVVCMPTITGGV